MVAHVKDISAYEATTSLWATTLTYLIHRRRNIASEALWAKWLVRVRLVVPEGSEELVGINFEAQLLSKSAVLVFEF